MDKLIQAARGNASDKHRMRFYINGKELLYIKAQEDISHSGGHTVTLMIPADEIEFLDGDDGGK